MKKIYIKNNQKKKKKKIKKIKSLKIKNPIKKLISYLKHKK